MAITVCAIGDVTVMTNARICAGNEGTQFVFMPFVTSYGGPLLCQSASSL